MDMIYIANKQNLPPFQADNDVCPVCHSDRYLNQSMKLFVSPCYHKMCESCIERLFSMGPAPCPICSQILRKTNFYQQVFEDLTVEKEIRIRARISKIFNRTQNEFKTLREYNDYLEMVEDITFRLLNNENVQETEEEIARYSQQHKDQISANLERQKREKRIEQLRKEQTEKEKDKNLEEYLEMIESEEKAKEDAKTDLITKLATSDKDAKEIIKENLITLKRSSMRQKSKNSQPGGYYSRPQYLDGLEESEDEEDVPINPFEDSYADIGNFTLKPSYVENNQIVKKALNPSGGFVQSMHYRYMLEAAFNGVDIPQL
ncbi:hypothetical protein BB559_002741 [Furculomyces boomerangus]|uniref:RNA polymerase II transcription factor B subunit 3 n=2 Tax=Harpellales TaxID=61421 RepID=A0A2T9YSV0_9FUNG|nr:hypothetical protein BB559_002741 [Furculomyces boomerangus]PVZ97351.1 hypothetical protein BB558_006687 [Smittium angustum]PVZ99171.1 hypothetical protein BB558_004808 [Smittium angustum]